ncbi:PD-(D/E)XK nuclease family protein [Mesobacillus maritimus]|uniref:PD-(D/E)XK nuclease family protein n=1 Tax=Mesobacillus maritimus TaxID=1643336 RepID=UPI00203EDBF7|nr:PD-(D/E)XK nuclease family protein [Mesobacillus maritimus]MCM3668592.1 PD-(D/E)XK nuclease family protein [Mesobacillus maritimus]
MAPNCSVDHQIVQEYYQLPLSEQKKLNVLKLIDRYWQKINPMLFDNPIQYYTVVAKITDHLLRFLESKEETTLPLFLFKKLDAYIDELESRVSLTFEVVEWFTYSFKIKKFLVEADREMVELYHYLMVVFAKKAFRKIPEQVEVINLLEGKRYTFTPSEEEVQRGILYLTYLKESVHKPDRYSPPSSSKECKQCPFHSKCTHSNEPIANKSDDKSRRLN